jgi:short-subunit dehydrogenase
MRRAIVIGASSGIGRALALRLAGEGWRVGLAARRLPLLLELQTRIGPESAVRRMDVRDPEQAVALLGGLIEELGGADLIVIAAGTGHVNPDLDWALERETVDVNVRGFTALADAALRYFLRRGRGHLVGISSLAALRGHGAAPAYNASKAYVSTYLDGLRHKVARLHVPVTITDIRPGFVDTAMAGGPHVFWAASPDEAARQILVAIRRRRRRAIVTRRWRLIAWLIRLTPDVIHRRID